MQNLHNHWTERFHHVIKITGSFHISAQHVTVICVVIGCSNCSDHDKEFSHCRISAVTDHQGRRPGATKKCRQTLCCYFERRYQQRHT